MSAPGSAITVDTHALNQHKTDIQNFAGQVDQAAEATSAGKTADFDAYGIVGQVFAMTIAEQIDKTTDCVNSMADTGHALVDGLMDTISSYDDAEHTNKDAMNTVDKERA